MSSRRQLRRRREELRSEENGEFSIDVPKEQSKCMLNPNTGDKVYYIDKNYGLSKKLSNKMVFTSVHPIHKNMCEIKATLNRI